MPEPEAPPARQVCGLARLSRAPQRSVRLYVSAGAQRKRSQNPESSSVVEVREGDRQDAVEHDAAPDELSELR
jgi:hypothetical protein